MRSARSTALLLTCVLLGCVASLTGCGVKQPLHTAALEALGEAQAATSVLEDELNQCRTDAGTAAQNQQGLEAEAAAQTIVDQLRTSLASPIEVGRLELRLRNGHAVIDLPEDLLFAAEKVEPGEVGQDTLAVVATALTALAEARFEVQAHIDQEPAPGSAFSNSWDFTAARAAAVVKELVTGGLAPDTLAAAGFGSHRPRTDNRSAEGRALNRRIEIVVLPGGQ